MGSRRVATCFESSPTSIVVPTILSAAPAKNLMAASEDWMSFLAHWRGLPPSAASSKEIWSARDPGVLGLCFQRPRPKMKPASQTDEPMFFSTMSAYLKRSRPRSVAGQLRPYFVSNASRAARTATSTSSFEAVAMVATDLRSRGRDHQPSSLANMSETEREEGRGNGGRPSFLRSHDTELRRNAAMRDGDRSRKR